MVSQWAVLRAVIVKRSLWRSARMAPGFCGCFCGKDVST